jgi:hypothetical protein
MLCLFLKKKTKMVVFPSAERFMVLEMPKALSHQELSSNSVSLGSCSHYTPLDQYQPHVGCSTDCTEVSCKLPRFLGMGDRLWKDVEDNWKHHWFMIDTWLQQRSNTVVAFEVKLRGKVVGLI